jgi:ATP-dependent Clp protease ATP-binding subunit ClpA
MYMREDLAPSFAESARRAIFFSKYEAAKAESPQVEVEHLVLGIVRERAKLLEQLARDAHVSLDSIRRKLDTLKTTAIGGGSELPFAPAAERVLEIAAENHGPEAATTIDLLIAILNGPQSRARDVLEEGGLTISTLARKEK